MSVEAMLWALKQNVGSCNKKMLLVSMCDRASEDFECWPSIKRLHNDTHLDRKTIMKLLEELQESGLIKDTGKRTGKTRSVKVFKILGIAPRESETTEAVPETVSLSSPNIGTSTETGTAKQYQFSHQAVPETEPLSGTSIGTQNQSYLEPIKEPQKRNKNGFDSIQSIELPESISRDLWLDWVVHRKQIKKPLSERAAKLTLTRLAEAEKAGHNPAELIEDAIVNGWQGCVFSQHLERQLEHPRVNGCPVNELIAGYHEVLPELRPVKKQTPEFLAQLVARWREHPNIESWMKLYTYIRDSDFLMKQDSCCDLRWLVDPENWAKTMEGRYHRG